MDRYRIFIVEDDMVYGEMMRYFLSLNPDYEVFRYTTAKDCLANLGNRPHLITLDYSLPDAKGGEVLEKIRKFDANIPVIIISGQKDITTAIELLKNGASDYLIKDDNTKDLLLNAVRRIRENHTLRKEVEQLKEELSTRNDPGKLIKGNSRELQKIFGLIEKSGKANINVSITGESGTGKELVAQAIHHFSDRKKKPFVAVNMAAIPRELIESELFGYEKGAFTGAVARKLGRFEEANGGTLFLDEIAELDLSVQSKLLRVLQEREVVRLGGSERIKLDVRIITATHKNLAEEVKRGNFREDLYYRLSGMPIALPPLRDRGNDVLLLAKYFLDSFCKANNLPQMTISTAAKDRLLSYSYPGNVRELKGVMELAAVMCSGKELEPDDITFHAATTGNQLMMGEKTLHQYNIDIIQTFLNKYDHNILKVADKLDIGKSTIYRMVKKKELTVK
jgi:two-component system, NtrC family, response regulator AtoC